MAFGAACSPELALRFSAGTGASWAVGPVRVTAARGSRFGKGVSVFFPGNKNSISCFLSQLSLTPRPPLPPLPGQFDRGRGRRCRLE